MDRQCGVDNPYRSHHPIDATAAAMETSSSDTRENRSHVGLLPWLLVCVQKTLCRGSMADLLLHSVVFASAYRTSVLFTYSATDPSYTLTPTVGWTAIEMSAGIISACLPTMLPVFNVVFRKLGLKADPNSTRNGSATDLWSKWSKSGTSRQNHTSGVAPNPDSTKSKDNLFYKLPDENSSIATRGTESETLATPNNARLRPDVKGYKYSIKSLSQEERNGADENGIPLGTIRVESAFERSTFSK